MTTPDPTPFLLPTDLRTAEDVARELRKLIQAGRTYTYEAADEIDARLERERRQACRRGARVMAHEAYMWRTAERESCRGETWAATYRERRAGALRIALALRAAARAK